MRAEPHDSPVEAFACPGGLLEGASGVESLATYVPKAVCRSKGISLHFWVLVEELTVVSPGSFQVRYSTSTSLRGTGTAALCLTTSTPLNRNILLILDVFTVCPSFPCVSLLVRRVQADTTVFNVGMTCEGCANATKRILGKMEGTYEVYHSNGSSARSTSQQLAAACA